MNDLSYGVMDFRDSAPALIRLAEEGQVITITRHGRPVAQLGPVEVRVKGEAERVPKMEASGA